MPINSAAAAGAYASVAKLSANQPNGAASLKPPSDPGDFGDMVMKAVKGVTEAGQATEAKAADLATGKADVVDLVTAVAETELAVESLVTVRDRMVSAYQDIMNMPI